jgi:hypothetical protein
MYAATVRSTQEPARPAPQPRKAHRAPVKVAELRAYAADLEAEIEARSEDGLTEARAVMRLVRIRCDVYAAIDALTRRGM